MISPLLEKILRSLYRVEKPDISSRVPLLPAALQILNRHAEHAQCKYGDRVLPVLSNQKMNA